MEITYKKYGTTIYFSGSDGIDDTKGIIDEDKPIKLVVLDELTEFFDDGEGEDELIYYMFGDRHRKKPDPNRRYDRIYIGGDYGQQNATTFEAFGLDIYRKKTSMKRLGFSAGKSH